MICIIENYFENIDSKEKAYFLGFLLCDSYITSNVIDIIIHPIDSEIIDSFCNNIKSDVLPKICYSYSNKRNITYSRYRLLIRNKKIINDLIVNFGGFCKDQRLQYKVPKNLISHFIRGIFDGDGTINTWIDGATNKQRYEIGISGRIELLQKIINDIDWNDKINITSDKSIYRFRTTNIKLVREFLNYIYKDSDNLRLSRKYNIAHNLLK